MRGPGTIGFDNNIAFLSAENIGCHTKLALNISQGMHNNHRIRAITQIKRLQLFRIADQNILGTGQHRILQIAERQQQRRRIIFNIMRQPIILPPMLAPRLQALQILQHRQKQRRTALRLGNGYTILAQQIAQGHRFKLHR